MQDTPSKDTHTMSLPTTFPHNSVLPESPVKEFTASLHKRFSRPSEDSQYSTSSESSASSRNHSLGHRHDSKEEDTKYPVLLQIKTAKSKSLTQSLKEFDILDTPVVAEEGEDEEFENQFLKKLPVVADGQEFNSKTHANRFRENLLTPDLNRCRSVETSFLPLDSVEEDKNEEDTNAFKQRRRFRLYSLKMEDLNEFNQNNQNERTPHERRGRRGLSVQMQAASEEVIIEEQENKALPHLNSVFGSYNSVSGSRRGSGLISSPGTRLRVDEIDFLEQKCEGEDGDSERDQIDTIMEELDEKIGQAEENKEFQVAKAKMNEEKEFMKKVIKGDIIDEIDSVLSRRSTDREFSYHGGHVTEEIIEEDNNENVPN